MTQQPADDTATSSTGSRPDSSTRSHDEADQARLWQVSEQLTGVSYALG